MTEMICKRCVQKPENAWGESFLDALVFTLYLLGVVMAISAMYNDVFIIEHFIIAMISLSSLIRMYLDWLANYDR